MRDAHRSEKSEHVSSADTSMVLETLEHDQLVAARRAPIPRRQLKGGELALLWALRLYLVFMFVVVCWQALIATR
jgi:hypothetical protein